MKKVEAHSPVSDSQRIGCVKSTALRRKVSSANETRGFAKEPPENGWATRATWAPGQSVVAAWLEFYHIGVVRGLWRAGLLPEVVVGASMGALVAAGICCRTEKELSRFFSGSVPDIDRIGFERRPWREVWSSRSLMRPERSLANACANCGEYAFRQAGSGVRTSQSAGCCNSGLYVPSGRV